MKDNIFTEFGIDFDNNKYGIGYGTEIEFSDGTEKRIKEIIKIKNKSYYIRIWLFKKVIILKKDGITFKTKNRNNFKIVFGISGINEDYKM